MAEKQATLSEANNKAPQAPPPAKRQTSVQDIAKAQIAMVEKRVNELAASGGLHLPKDYSAPNALRAAWLILQEVVDMDKLPALQVCTPASITNALLSMVVQGLDPQKKQGYFIVYGAQLAFQRSYFGAMALTRRVNPAIPEAGFSYAVVYAGDVLEYEIVKGRKRIVSHKQKLENIDKGKIVAAYCEIFDAEDKLINSELMTMDEIKQSWKQSKMKPIQDNGQIKPGSTHEKFTADMALRTVINKVCKSIINSSSDAELLKAVKASEDMASEAEAEAEAELHANGEVIDVEVETGEVVDAEFSPAHAQEQPATATAGPGF